MTQAEVGLRRDLRVIDPREIPHVLAEGELGAALEWMVRDPSGKVVEHVIRKSESFLQQFLQLLQVKMTYMPTARSSIRDTSNTLRAVCAYTAAGTPAGYLLDVLAGATVTTFGTVVGTDAGGPHVPTITDYNLVTLIAHGVGAGAMQYGALTFGAPGSDATTSQLTITRNFTANAGGITVMEAGLICRAYYTAAAYFLIIRDTIAGGIVVGAGNVLTLNYRLQATV